MLTSIKLAEERGGFPAIKGSLYDPEDMRWCPPQPIFPYENNYNRPDLNWDSVVEGIQKHGIRNAAQTTIAPTGTIATVAGCEGYGCEPVFALAYIRHVNDNGDDLKLNYISPNFQKALDAHNFDAEIREQIIDQILESGSCQDVDGLPHQIKDVYVVSSDITAEEHVRMQAALQAFVDNSLSKTINFPENATPEDVAQAYLLAWELGCKGITVYVTGSREQVVLETKSTAKSKQTGVGEITPQSDQTGQPDPAMQLSIWHETKKPRPRSLKGYTCSIETPLGKTYVTVNENGENQPFEVFINTAKAGTETAAHSEAIGRLISYILRIASPVEPRKRLTAIMEQLSGIGGGRSLGFGANRIRSLPDGIAKALDEYLYNRYKDGEEKPQHQPLINAPTLPLADIQTQNSQKPKVMTELCPECGQASLVNEEGCRKCYSCGYSEC
jgi:ribonucleoside-diphosphate reductase alpha chain